MRGIDYDSVDNTPLLRMEQKRRLLLEREVNKISVENKRGIARRE